MTKHPSFLYDEKLQITIVPVRHHSPACAFAVRLLLDEIKPKTVLIEGPNHYDRLIDQIIDDGTVPPVAIVTFPSKNALGSSYYPICSHSPEYVGLLWAHQNKVETHFIDLPIFSRFQNDTSDDNDNNDISDDESDEEKQSHIADKFVPLSKDYFDSSDYTKALCQKIGCRDGDELWDQMFETQLGESDWRGLFSGIGVYCDHMRQSTNDELLQRDGTLEREAQMAAIIARESAKKNGPIVIIVGGFHAPVLLDLVRAPQQAKIVETLEESYLIRYGFRQLNALTGYMSGLPFPWYYDRLWQQQNCIVEDKTKPSNVFEIIAEKIVIEFIAHLRKDMRHERIAFPALVNALEMANGLAQLRGHKGPMRSDIIDALRTALLKGHEGGEGSGILAEFYSFLTGSTIGAISSKAAAPPLLRDFFAKARALGIKIDDGEARNRTLDIYRKPKHRAISRFLHGMKFLNVQFASRTAGPDFSNGYATDRLFESWTIQWSPLTEARLIELASESDTLQKSLLLQLFHNITALKENGHGGETASAVRLFITACEAGLSGAAKQILPLIEQEIIADANLVSVVDGLKSVLALWQARKWLALDDEQVVRDLIAICYRRAMFLLPNIIHADNEQSMALVDALANLRELLILSEREATKLDGEIFQERIANLLTNTDAPPAIRGAIAALACLNGQISDEQLVERFAGEIQAAYSTSEERVGWLHGVITISRELLWRVSQLMEKADMLLTSFDDDSFLEILPFLRLAFSRLDPDELDRLGKNIGKYYHQEDFLLLHSSLDENTVLKRLALEQDVLAQMQEEQLI
ncbi:DUF5682 family protein [Bartonella sp. HY761]|uniref:DUF5682 family protein n=1 Tax=Bartonella sp. HY761 TaxID=2979330 RepID=UPI00220A6D5C|nr:DUF5682 family protein [Bartonella sp. HY761]UXN06198.1 DUF5682 family protein [Bartonella sp. HY761]